MSKPSLRKNILLNSVRKLVDENEQVHDVVMLWTRHRLFVPYCIFAGAALFGVANASGIEGIVNQVVIGGCGVAVAGLATTNHWVLVKTSEGLLLCKSSRVRQYATSVSRRLRPDTTIKMVGSTLTISDWRIGDTVYTLTKRWEATMRVLANGATDR